jgi:putative hydrolase of the HAD superfamily
VKPTLSRLRKKGYKLAIISDAPAIKAWVRLVAMDMDSLFDVVVTFDDTKRRKPHYLPFKNVLEKLKLGPREVMMVGDNIKRDIVGARALGIKTVFARYGLVGKPRKAVKADFQIDKIEDLLKIMNKAK